MVVPTRPLLAAWGSDTLYLYEFVSNIGFKLVSSANLSSDTLPPELKFLKDQITLVTLRKEGSLYLATWNFLLTSAYTSLTKSYQTARLDTSKVSNFIILHKAQSDLSTNGIAVLEDDSFVQLNSAGLQSNDLKCVALHPNDDYYLMCSAYNTSKIMPKVAVYLDEYPLFNNSSTNPWTGVGTLLNNRVFKTINGITSGNIIACDWTNSGEYAYLVCSDGYIYTYEVANETSSDFEFNKLYATPFSNTPIAIAVRPDDKHIAVSVINGSSQYITYIYDRVGYLLVLKQTITDFGRQIDWTADGSMLIDATARRLFVYDAVEEIYEENSAYMTDLVTGLIVQTMNNYTPARMPQAYLFNSIKSSLISRTGIDLDNLKLMLLDADATFDATETSILDISAANEVSGGGWPTGGKLLENVGYSVLNDKVALIADDLIGEISTNLVFKSAVIYDTTSDKPVVWIPSINSTIEKNTNLVFEFSKGIITIDS